MTARTDYKEIVARAMSTGLIAQPQPAPLPPPEPDLTHNPTIRALRAALFAMQREMERIKARMALYDADDGNCTRMADEPLGRLEEVVTAHVGPLLWNRARPEYLCRPRRWFMWLAIQHGYKPSALAKYCGRERTLIINQVKRVEREIILDGKALLANTLLAETGLKRKIPLTTPH